MLQIILEYKTKLENITYQDPFMKVMQTELLFAQEEFDVFAKGLSILFLLAILH